MVLVDELIEELPSKALELKEEGNKWFREGEFQKAISCYIKCLNFKDDKEDLVTAHKNLAAALLKIGKFEEALKNCDAALELNPGDLKALFRRVQAYDGLERYSDALKDGMRFQHLDPKNQSIKQLLVKINEKYQKRVKEMASTSQRVESMFKLINDTSIDREKKEQAVENLLVLARDNCGAQLIVDKEGYALLRKVIEDNFGRNDNIVLSAIRVVSELCKHSPERSKSLLDTFEGISYLLSGISNCRQENLITAIQYAIQTILGAFSGHDIKEAKKPDENLMKIYQKEIDSVMTALIQSSSRRAMTGPARDAVIELIMRNSDYDTINWGQKVVTEGHLYHLLDIASELEDIKYESSMEITENTRPHVALTLERILSCLDNDKRREMYRDQVMEYMNDKLRSPDIESKVRVTALITTLLKGPIEIGNQCLSQRGLVEMMLVMAGSDGDEVQQRVAAEAIIAAASKKDKCTSIVSMGTGILKKLYQSPNDGIRVRALVGLCKLGSVGGTDAAFRPFSDGSIQKLFAACRKYLISPSKTKDLKKWAAEGLAYLTLDADVKEEIVEDEEAIKALISLAESGDMSCLYGVITTLVNLTNSYEKNEVMPEMLELAKFAKQHVPEEHVKDKKDYVDKRVQKLAKMNLASALVSLSKTNSNSARELICRVFNAICEFKEFRGNVVSVGGAKVLLKMALENNSAPGRLQAAQALARIGITINPEVAFPGQRAAEVVRPIKELLHMECSALKNFEALMALTNLAQLSDSVSDRVLKDDGLSKIEHYMYEDHEMLRRAATQCINNLIAKPRLVAAYEGENDRVKLLVILSEEDDLPTAKAAAGALATLTSISPICCKKVFDAKRWFEILMMLTSSKDQELQHRGVMIVRNMVHSDKETAEKVMETSLFEVLLAITRPEVDDISPQIKKLAQETLTMAQELKLIKSAEEAKTRDGLNENDPD